MFGIIADRLVLVPSTDPIDSAGQQRLVIDGALGELEIYERSQAPQLEATDSGGLSKILVLKFPGAGGRAERSTLHPTEAWPHLESIVWTVNPPGYGKSYGRPRIQNLGPMATDVFQAAVERYPEHEIVICGNSLGNLPALFLAANHPDRVAGLLMRNPPPLREVIQQRHPWWKTFGIASLIASSIPQELDCIANAKRCRSRAILVTCEYDRIVPARLQNQILATYGGEIRQLVARGVDHAEPIPENQLPNYADLLKWLVRSASRIR